jgi:hypothetical protein
MHKWNSHGLITVTREGLQLLEHRRGIIVVVVCVGDGRGGGGAAKERERPTPPRPCTTEVLTEVI